MEVMEQTETLPLELRKFGLNDKETRVYLAALELGPTSVQKIARQAGISRPTAYEIIKGLEEKELMTESKQKSPAAGRAEHRYFAAESPDKLLGILRKQKRELEEKEREFIRIIAALRAKYYLAGEQAIKVFAGRRGVAALIDEFITSAADQIYVLVANDKVWPRKEREAAYQQMRRRLGEIEIKEKKIAPDKSFQGALLISDQAIILLSPTKGLSIENKSVLGLLRRLAEQI